MGGGHPIGLTKTRQSKSDPPVPFTRDGEMVETGWQSINTAVCLTSRLEAMDVGVEGEIRGVEELVLRPH